MKTYFVDVILPLALPKSFTYRVPGEYNERIRTGQRVLVQFGKQKIYTGIIRRVHQNPPKEYEAKYFYELIDDAPSILETQFTFWNWISSYYMCTIGEVYSAGFPSGLKISSETVVVPNRNTQYDESKLSDREFLILEALSVNEKLSMSEIEQIAEIKSAYPLIRKLIERKLVLLEEELKESYKPLKKSYVRLSESYRSEPALKSAFDELGNAPRQLHIMMKLIELGGTPDTKLVPVAKTALQKAANASSAQVKALTEKGFLEIIEVEEGRLPDYKADPDEKKLNTEQKKSIAEIKTFFEEDKPVLLHGVTGSGKTEVFIKLIEETMKDGGQTLYLLPEIALTTQIITRLEKQFGDAIAVYHSRFNANERAETWHQLLANPKIKVILGARSAVFLPFQNLKLIIVDEEHEHSYKQFDPAPRYHARDAAVVLSKIHDARILLGSATPSVESYANTQSGKYNLSVLTKRHGKSVMPAFEVIDLKESYKRKQMKSSFSKELMEAVEKALSNNEQVILFQNRRGFSPFIQCHDCGWSPECNSCDVSLTYHKFLNLLKCHYCGNSKAFPGKCPACGSANVNLKSYGTEKIEDDLSIYFPDAVIKRMDFDTTRGKKALQSIISSFEDKEVDILVGTQMVTKGLDFDHVRVAGIINADQMLHFQDFRAHERAFQLMTQVAGRAGRREKKGSVFIQTFEPDHPVIKQVVAHDYLSMFQTQAEERKAYWYPPYYKLIRLTLKHRDKDAVNDAADFLAKQLRTRFGKRILGPEYPPVARVRNFYLKRILIKMEPSLHLGKTKVLIDDFITVFKQHKTHRKVRISIDVDPY